jgi:hypothetical protein
MQKAHRETLYCGMKLEIMKRKLLMGMVGGGGDASIGATPRKLMGI